MRPYLHQTLAPLKLHCLELMLACNATVTSFFHTSCPYLGSTEATQLLTEEVVTSQDINYVFYYYLIATDEDVDTKQGKRFA